MFNKYEVSKNEYDILQQVGRIYEDLCGDNRYTYSQIDEIVARLQVARRTILELFKCTYGETFNSAMQRYIEGSPFWYYNNEVIDVYMSWIREANRFELWIYECVEERRNKT